MKEWLTNRAIAQSSSCSLTRWAIGLLFVVEPKQFSRTYWVMLRLLGLCLHSGCLDVCPCSRLRVNEKVWILSGDRSFSRNVLTYYIGCKIVSAPSFEKYSKNYPGLIKKIVIIATLYSWLDVVAYMNEIGAFRFFSPWKFSLPLAYRRQFTHTVYRWPHLSIRVTSYFTTADERQ